MKETYDDDLDTARPPHATALSRGSRSMAPLLRRLIFALLVVAGLVGAVVLPPMFVDLVGPETAMSMLIWGLLLYTASVLLVFLAGAVWTAWRIATTDNTPIDDG